MKKLLTLLFALVSFAASAQITLLGGIGSRVNDSTAYVTSTAVIAAHSNGYHDLWFSNASNLWWVWNGSSYVQWDPSASGGSFWPLSGTATRTDETTIEGGGHDLNIQGNGDVYLHSDTSVVFDAGLDLLIESLDKQTFIAGDSINFISPFIHILTPPITADTTAYLLARRASDGAIVKRNVSTISGSGGGATAAGATGNVQYKSAGGGLQAEAALTYDSAANILTIPNAKITGGSPGANKVLTSDADGDASWVAGVIGAQDLFITGPAMWPTVTNGCSEPATDEIGGKTYKVLDFDQSADENAQFQFSLPRNWNNGTITATVYWTATTGSGTVQFEVSAVALSNDDPFSGSFGTAVAIDDTLIATDDVHISPTSSAITIGGTPADGDLVFINIMRDVSDDTLSGDARILGIRITITLDAAVSE